MSLRTAPFPAAIRAALLTLRRIVKTMARVAPLPSSMPRVACVALCLCLSFLPGCRSAQAPPTAPAGVLVPTSAPDAAGEPLPLRLTREQREARILEGLQKRIAGRKASLPDIERIVTEIGPIVAAAAEQPQAQAALRRMAREAGLSAEAMRARWLAMQEADLLLESGGRPDVVSVSDAVGVAQWLAGTANGAGLPVNLRESNRLTAKINPLKRQIAWREYLLRPDADPALPGAPPLSPAAAQAQLPALKRELEMLRAKRRKVDGRYDPRRAIFAQTRYLLRLYNRFPSADWIFQAYHGGEGGATRTLRKFLGSAWPGSAASAIRYGNAGRPLRYEDLYFATTPRARPEAFAYLYGRSDDHRRYWWKLRASMEAIALYRRDPAAFRRQWEAFFPGRPTDAVWYPDAPSQVFADLASVQSAHASRRLLPANPPPAGIALRPAPLDTGNARWYAALRPETQGALRLLAATYRQAGGPGMLRVGDLAVTQPMSAQAKALYPPKPPKGPPWPPDPDAKTLPGGGPPANFDYHTIGIAFDILRPADPRQRKTLEYALDMLADRLILAWADARDLDARRYHVVPNPRYAAALAQIAQTGRVPALSEI